VRLVGKVIAWIVGGVVATVVVYLLFFFLIPYWRAPDTLNRAEAQVILTSELAQLRAKPYRELAGLVEKRTARQVNGESGAEYTTEVSFYWDGEPNEDVRVIASISDGGKSAYIPLSESFIKSSNGRFVGE
jgi:hypothetical protein